MEEQSINSKTGAFTYYEIAEITSNFKTIIGEGGFGKVYFGLLNADTPVAVKVLSPSSKQGYKEFLAEVKVLEIVRHENLVSLVGYCDEDGNKALIYEYMANGNLGQYLSENSKTFPCWNKRLQIARDTALGLEYLHRYKPPIVHRDLKPANILFTEYMQAKISDFGLARAFATESASHISTCFGGSFGYLDPESFNTGLISKKSDVYSFGVILLQLVTGRPAVIKRDEEDRTHITNWIDSLGRKGDIHIIVDQRFNGEFNITAAQKAIEIEMSCVKPIRERPDMSHVRAELEKCLDIETDSRVLDETNFLTWIGRIYKNITKRQKGTCLFLDSDHE